MQLLFLHGKPGVGKLTVARQLQRLTGYGLFHNHLTVDLAASVFEFGTPPFVELREHIWLEVFRRSAKADIPGLIFTFAAEKTVPEAFPDTVLRLVRAHGSEVVFVELTCDPAELNRRVEHPTRERYGKLTSADVLERLTGEGVLFDLAIPEGAKGIVVDTTHLGPEEAAAQIVSRLPRHG